MNSARPHAQAAANSRAAQALARARGRLPAWPRGAPAALAARAGSALASRASSVRAALMYHMPYPYPHAAEAAAGGFGEGRGGGGGGGLAARAGSALLNRASSMRSALESAEVAMGGRGGHGGESGAPSGGGGSYGSVTGPWKVERRGGKALRALPLPELLLRVLCALAAGAIRVRGPVLNPTLV